MDLSTENPFADLMSKAVKLKGAQQAQLRTQFDSWPQYLQHSLFMQESVVTARSKPDRERLAAAESMKAAGNAHFNSSLYEEAVAEYEKALAVFKYLENKDPGWKKKGIEDADMLFTDFKCDNIDDQERLVSLKTSSYLNIAVAKYKLKEYPVCIRACDDTLELNPNCVKALYRRALALITPASSGATEFNRAISDLQKAYAIDKKNCEVRKLLRELIKQRTKQRALDRKTFSGMFNRGYVYGENSENQVAELNEVAQEQKYRREVDEAEALARGFEAKGKVEFAKEIREKIAQSQETRDHRLKRVDFFNPTFDMIADAKKNGIDLTDKKVQQMLHDLQKEERLKRSLPHEKHFKNKQSPPSAIESIDSLLKSMSTTEIAQLLEREGVDYHKISDRGQFLDMARQILLSTVNCRKKSTKSSYARTIVLVAIAWTLLRLYTSGGLSILGQFTMNAFSGIHQSSGVSKVANVMDMFEEN